MKTDNDFIAEMDIPWLLAHGWTVKGNLAFRRILESGNYGLERIEQIIIQYECSEEEIAKIKEQLQELNDLKQILGKIFGN